MDRDQIIRLAHSTGLRNVGRANEGALLRFAAAVRAAALEESAQMCEAQEGDRILKVVAKGCAAAIRSLASEGEKT